MEHAWTKIEHADKTMDIYKYSSGNHWRIVAPGGAVREYNWDGSVDDLVAMVRSGPGGVGPELAVSKSKRR